VVSREIYYPYGGTAQWATLSTATARDKFRRYSGQERDVTGLSYYGFRYYSPWLMRWLNTDPAGLLDGLNILAFTSNNPVTWQDQQGLMRVTDAAQQRIHYRCSKCCNDIFLGD
jgi:insecticidal toxin complex protein TccC